MRKIKRKISIALCLFISACIIVLAGICIDARLTQCFSKDDTAVLAAMLSMPNGSAMTQHENEEKTLETTATELSRTITPSEKPTVSHEGEKTYSVIEKQYTGPGLNYESFFVRNTTGYELNIEEQLKKPLGFEIADTREVQVLITHTHTCESYLDIDQGYYYESFYPRTEDNNYNVVRVGDAIVNGLKARGIRAVHDTATHDSPSYNGSYQRSRAAIDEYIKKYPQIKVVLDIHRDSITSESLEKTKPTFLYEGQKAAQIMILSGHDDGDGEFPNWEKNLNFALKLQRAAESMYPGFTRPMSFGDFTYNMDVNTGSLLIEVGTDANTLEEAVRSGEMLANALSRVLQKE